MRIHATPFEFRYRSLIMVVLYATGFVAPWHWLVPEPVRGETWGLLIAQLNRSRVLSFNASFVLVNALVLACAWAASLIRCWATSFLGAGTVGSDAMGSVAIPGGEVVTAGPYHYLRHPLYLGAWLLAFPVAILMEPTGAAFLIITLTLFLLRLARAEQLFLGKQVGEAHRRYRENVPGILPRITASIPENRRRADWIPAVIAESYGLMLAITFSIFCWSFNGQLLLRCAMIAFGVSLVLHALLIPYRKRATQ